LEPLPYDDVARSATFSGGYNATLSHFAALDQNLARKRSDAFVNLNPPVVAAFERARTFDPLMARLILPDRVHPDTIAHWVMAEAVLTGWNSPRLVSSVTIDAPTTQMVDVQNAVVDHVEREKDTLVPLHWISAHLWQDIFCIMRNRQCS
jgi:hypothetical protein